MDPGCCKAAAIIFAGPVGTEQAYVLLARAAEAMCIADTGDKQDYSCLKAVSSHVKPCSLSGLTAGVEGCSQQLLGSESSLSELRT